MKGFIEIHMPEGEGYYASRRIESYLVSVESIAYVAPNGSIHFSADAGDYLTPIETYQEIVTKIKEASPCSL